MRRRISYLKHKEVDNEHHYQLSLAQSLGLISDASTSLLLPIFMFMILWDSDINTQEHPIQATILFAILPITLAILTCRFILIIRNANFYRDRYFLSDTEFRRIEKNGNIDQCRWSDIVRVEGGLCLATKVFGKEPATQLITSDGQKITLCPAGCYVISNYYEMLRRAALNAGINSPLYATYYDYLIRNDTGTDSIDYFFEVNDA